jgi:hypothetical protein
MLRISGRTDGTMKGLNFKDEKQDGLRRHLVNIQVRDLRNGDVELWVEDTAIDGGKQPRTAQICHSFTAEAWVELKKMINTVGLI